MCSCKKSVSMGALEPLGPARGAVSTELTAVPAEEPLPLPLSTVPLGKLCGLGRSRLLWQQREGGEEVIKAIPWEKLGREDLLT